MRSRIEVNKVDEAMRRYGQIERKVDEMEAYADLINVGDRSLEAQFQELARRRVDREGTCRDQAPPRRFACSRAGSPQNR
jgi:phage shock protein A